MRQNIFPTERMSTIITQSRIQIKQLKFNIDIRVLWEINCQIDDDKMYTFSFLPLVFVHMIVVSCIFWRTKELQNDLP